MANRRMISKGIFCSDTFTELPQRVKLLYVYLILEADDDGLIGTSKNALFLSGANARDLKTLVERGYIIKFDNGVCCIRHWLQMNKVQITRKQATAYLEEFSQLEVLEDKTYKICRQNVDKMSTQSKSISLSQSNSIQDSLGKPDEKKGGNMSPNNSAKGDNMSPNNLNEALSFMDNPDYKKVHRYFSDRIGTITQIEHYKTLNTLLKEIGLNALLACIDFMADNSEGKSVPYLKRIVSTHPELYKE